MKPLLIVSAVIELGAGVVLMCCPSAAVAILLGSPLDASAAVALGRVAGAALLALGAACWSGHCDAQGRAARGIVVAMVLYNLGVLAVLSAAGVLSRLVGVALWPAVAVHAGMTVWCVACLLRQPHKLSRT